MFFFRSCSASVVCLVSTFLAVYISHCDSVPVTGDKYLSTGLLPMINNIFKKPLSQLAGLESLFKSNCSQNEAYPEKDSHLCVSTVLDFTATVNRLSKSPVEKFTSELSSVFKEFCMNRTALQECFQRSYQESSHCWMDGIKKNWPLITDLMNSLSARACSEEGDRVAQYLADGGYQCLLDKEEDIKVCFNKTITAHIPTYLLYATPERQLDEEDCNDIKTLQKCALKHLETCETKSTAVFVNTTLNKIWNSNCSNHATPVLDKAEIQGDLGEEEGPLFYLASGLSLAYMAGESIAKSAISTLTSIINTQKEASPGLDTNASLGSRDSITPIESTRQINKVDEEENVSISRKIDGNSTHGDIFSAREGDGEPTKDYPDEVQSPVQADGNVETEEVPSTELGTNATYHHPTDASQVDNIPSRIISVIGTNISRRHVDLTTTGPPVDHTSILNHTTLLVISSYVVLSLVIIVLITTLYCESLLPQAD